jgi:hypothetical protein
VHPYSVDSGERFRITAIIVFLGVATAYLVYLIQDLLGFSWPWWFDAPAAIGTGTIYYNLFDRWGWRLRLFRFIGLVETPDFAGKWIGTGLSSHDVHETKFEATMSISQRWTAMKITLETGSSRSESEIAAIKINEGSASELCHTYTNRPKSGSSSSMQIHSGTATLRINSSRNEIDGEYYAGRGRLTEGRLNFRRR